MKKYSCKQAKKGKTAYRTPSDKRYQLVVRNAKRRLNNYGAKTKI